MTLDDVPHLGCYDDYAKWEQNYKYIVFIGKSWNIPIFYHVAFITENVEAQLLMSHSLK